MSDKPLVLVTGATGAIGPVIVDTLNESGYRVRTLSLEASPDVAWPKDAVESFTGDVTNPSDVAAALQGVDAVIHLAALLHVVNPPSILHDRYKSINVGGTKTLVDAAIRFQVKRLLLFSTIVVYGNSNGQILNENTPPAPVTLYGQSKLEAEKIVLSALDATGQPVGTVLRLATVYGSRLKGNYEYLLRALKKGWFPPIGKGLNRRTLIYVKDAASAAILALSHPAAAGKIFNVTDGQYHTMHEIIAAMCGALGRRTPRFHVPVTPVQIAAALMEDAASLLGFRSPVCRSTINTYLEDIAVDGRRIQTDLGFQPQFDLISGWRDTIQEMLRSG